MIGVQEERDSRVSPASRSEHKKGGERQMSYLANQRPILRVTAEVILTFCCAAPLVLALTYGVQSLIN